MYHCSLGASSRLKRCSWRPCYSAAGSAPAARRGSVQWKDLSLFGGTLGFLLDLSGLDPLMLTHFKFFFWTPVCLWGAVGVGRTEVRCSREVLIMQTVVFSWQRRGCGVVWLILQWGACFCKPASTHPQKSEPHFRSICKEGKQQFPLLTFIRVLFPFYFYSNFMTLKCACVKLICSCLKAIFGRNSVKIFS